MGVVLALSVGTSEAAFAGPFKQLSVLAGQPGGAGSRDAKGSLAHFSFPSAIVFDGKTTAYVADTQNSTIRAIALKTGVVSTLAGKAGLTGFTDGRAGAARFFHPTGLALSAGYLMVADTGNSTLRAINLRSKTVVSMAGVNGQVGSADGFELAATFNQPSGLAYDQARGILYIADTGNQTIRALNIGTATVSTLTGSVGVAGAADGPLASAQFSRPVGLAYDGTSKLFVADSENVTVRQIDLNAGMVSTVAGTAGSSGFADGFGPSAQFQGPSGLALDGQVLYITDAASNTLRELDLSTTLVTTVAGAPGAEGAVDGIDGASRFSFPTAAAFDAVNGNLYVTDRDNSTVRSFATVTQTVTTVAGLAASPGNADGSGMAARFNGPTGLFYDSVLGATYVADMINETIRMIDGAGNVTTLAGAQGVAGSADGTGSAAQFYGPLGLAMDGSNDLLVADVQNDTIRVLSPTTKTVVTFAGQAGTPGTDDGFRLNARFNQPSGVVYDGVGAIYVADTNNDTIRKIDLNSWNVSTVAGSPGISGSVDGTGSGARFNHPVGIAYDGTGTFYITDTGNDVIRKMDAAGNVITLAGIAGIVGAKNAVGQNASFNVPQGIVYATVPGRSGPIPVLYVTDSGNSLVREIVISTARVSTVLGKVGQAGVIAKTPTSPLGLGNAPGGLNNPVGLAFGPLTGLYIADEAENVVLLAH